MACGISPRQHRSANAYHGTFWTWPAGINQSDALSRHEKRKGAYGMTKFQKAMRLILKMQTHAFSRPPNSRNQIRWHVKARKLQAAYRDQMLASLTNDSENAHFYQLNNG
jgi:hypothetical protein